MISDIMLLTLIRPDTANAFLAFGQSNMFGKLIVFVLFIGSAFTWSIMVTKYMEFKTALRGCDAFHDLYRKQSFPTKLFSENRRMLPNPVMSVYKTTCARLSSVLKGRDVDVEQINSTGVMPSGFLSLHENEARTIRDAADQAVAEQILHLENNMGLLATAVTAAPFLGLLGTVWGVMDAFGGIGLSGSATLSAMAPGISAALLTTVVGLLVALPSAIGYNMLTGKIRKLTVKTEGFAQELVADLECRFTQT